MKEQSQLFYLPGLNHFGMAPVERLVDALDCMKLFGNDGRLTGSFAVDSELSLSSSTPVSA